MAMDKSKEEFYQQKVDEFYKQNGRCCAGCDNWRFHNSFYGECIKSSILSSGERTAMIGIKFNSAVIEPGHVITPREFVCGLFEDSFDWSTLDGE